MAEMIACEDCDALNPAGTSFCTACGVKIVARSAE